MIRSKNDPEKSLSGAQQYSRAKDAFLANNIFTTRVTHGGRHSGAMEAETLGVPIDVIKRGGNWKDRLGRLETHYLGKLPTQFAKGIAGFWDEPFNLPRNSINPPLDLQRLVFPWIEDFFGLDNAQWRAVCDKEMEEAGEITEDVGIANEDTEDVQFVHEGVDSASGSGSGSLSSKRKQKQPLYRKIDTAKRGFLKLLIRCRRIILQDAAVLLHEKRENNIVNRKCNDNTPNLFASALFQHFQDDLITILRTPAINQLQQYEHLVPSIVDAQKAVVTRLVEIGNKLERQQKTGQERIEALEGLMQQQTQGNRLMENNIQQVVYNQQVLSQQMAIANQQFLNSQVQLFTALTALQQQNLVGSSTRSSFAVPPLVVPPCFSGDSSSAPASAPPPAVVSVPFGPSIAAFAPPTVVAPSPLPRLLAPTPVPQSPTISPSTGASGSAKLVRKRKAATKWVSYDPSSSSSK